LRAGAESGGFLVFTLPQPPEDVFLKLLRNKWFILGLVAVVIAILAAFTLNRKAGPEYFTSMADEGDIRSVVDATGTINAVITVQVGSQVSGNVSQLFADFNSHVKKGQLIAQIEPSLFEGAVLQAKADLENAKANLATSKANLEKSKAALDQTKADYFRALGLTKDGVMSQQQLDLAKANYDSAVAAVSGSEATVTQAVAQIDQRRAALSVAQTNLDHTHIYAPIDGVVVNRAVDVGQTVAASLQAPTIFTIAQDLTKMQVYAKTDEADVGQIHAGQKVSFKVDAFPKETFEGTVMQVRMNPTTVQNVVTYDTIINFDNPEMKLFPGMTAYVTIPVAEVMNVLKIPNGAIRYRPDLKQDEVAALYKKYGLDDAAGSGPRSGKGAGSSGQSAPNRWQGQRSERPGGASDAAGPREKPADIAVVWKLHADRTLEPVRVKMGITDHTVTEVTRVLKGDLKKGDDLVIGSASLSGGNRPPGMGGPGPGGGVGGPRR
jgi:HlyD family secretion protein